jgi:hypothetical protein
MFGFLAIRIDAGGSPGGAALGVVGLCLGHQNV